MWQAVLLAFLAGVLAANAYPYFAKGITAQRFPTVFGSSPVINVLAGWSGLALAGLCLWGAHPVRYPGWAARPGRRHVADGSVPRHRPYDRPKRHPGERSRGVASASQM